MTFLRINYSVLSFGLRKILFGNEEGISEGIVDPDGGKNITQEEIDVE